jgi:hypothetical protein
MFCLGIRRNVAITWCSCWIAPLLKSLPKCPLARGAYGCTVCAESIHNHITSPHPILWGSKPAQEYERDRLWSYRGLGWSHGHGELAGFRREKIRAAAAMWTFKPNQSTGGTWGPSPNRWVARWIAGLRDTCWLPIETETCRRSDQKFGVPKFFGPCAAAQLALPLARAWPQDACFLKKLRHQTSYCIAVFLLFKVMF